MENTITIKIEAPELVKAIAALTAKFSTQDIYPDMEAKLENVLNGITGQAPAVSAATQIIPAAPTTPVVPIAPAAPAAPSASVAPTAVIPAPTMPAPAAPTTARTYTIDELALASRPIVEAGKQVELLNLLHSFRDANGQQIKSIVQLPKEQYGTFAAGLRQLGDTI